MRTSTNDLRPSRESREMLGPRAASQRVLIVEDEKRLRELLHASVVEMGLTPTTTSSGESALKLVEQSFFALAVVDLNLPGMNGMELCERLHALKLHMQIIILTGFGDLETARQAIRLEVVDFLTKPCRMDDLESALNRARLRWLDRWNDGARPAETQGSFTDPEPASTQAATTALHSVNTSDSSASDDHSIDHMERQLILAALHRHNGNRQAAAADLGISVRKIYYRLQQYQRQGLLPEE